MTYNPDIHHRHSIRLRKFDYTSARAYFVTICVWQRECSLGNIEDGAVVLSTFGNMILKSWLGLPKHFMNIALDEFVVMPNHLHGIITISESAGAKQGSSASPGFGTASGSLGAIIQNFKSVSTRMVNKTRMSVGMPLWQRNYYERVIRNDDELNRAREYIRNNPLRWELDKENPSVIP